MIHFCTYCDSGYAARLLCLHESLRAQGESFVLNVLCFDDAVEQVVRAANFPDLVAIPLAQVLAFDPAFARARTDRSRIEFYFTATPVLVRYCFHRHAEAEAITYLDSDLCFFGPASAVLHEQLDSPIAIVPHRFPLRLAALERHGRFNVGWVSFRRDAIGCAAVDWWRERCLEWCHDREDSGRYADQGYLNAFPERYAAVSILDHEGINAAPWNVDGASIQRHDGRVTINGRPLLFFHFQGVRELLPGWFDPGLLFYATPLTPDLREHVYAPYLRRLATHQALLEREHGIVPRRGYHRVAAGLGWRERWHRFALRWLLPGYRLMRGQLIRAGGAE